MAAELARMLPTLNPLSLSAEQKTLVGEPLAKMLKSRVAYHHSGGLYGARAELSNHWPRRGNCVSLLPRWVWPLE